MKKFINLNHFFPETYKVLYPFILACEILSDKSSISIVLFLFKPIIFIAKVFVPFTKTSPTYLSSK